MIKSKEDGFIPIRWKNLIYILKIEINDLKMRHWLLKFCEEIKTKKI